MRGCDVARARAARVRGARGDGGDARVRARGCARACVSLRRARAQTVRREDGFPRSASTLRGRGTWRERRGRGGAGTACLIARDLGIGVGLRRSRSQTDHRPRRSGAIRRCVHSGRSCRGRRPAVRRPIFGLTTAETEKKSVGLWGRLCSNPAEEVV